MILSLAISLSVILLTLQGGCLAISCTSQLQSLSCLPVFTHTPATLEKCYCSSQCPDIQTLTDTCFSGQLQTDPCGICLQCAPGFGEKCGGFGNAEGLCAGGLGCLINYRPGVETEHNKTGTCVTEQGEDCQNPRAGVSCRPGQLGVPSDFVFCPPRCTTGSNRNKRPGTGFLFGNGPTRRDDNPAVDTIDTIGQGVRTVVSNVPDTVKDTVREFLTG